jgi:2-methylcitrate dehydratase PrpD
MNEQSDPTAEVAEWIAALKYEDISEEARHAAQRAIIDTIAVILAGSTEEGVKLTAAVAEAEGGVATCHVLGTRTRTSTSLAALVNGTAAHALDYDDTQSNVIGHPSAVIVPAALAVAEAVNASGPDLIEAYVAGLEVMGKAGRMLGHVPYNFGWHMTSVVGPLGAAAAAGKLMGLGPEELQVALGIAASQSSGSRQNFGTMTKPFHVGWAAHGGVIAAMLAAQGYTANRQMLTAPLGLTTLFQGDARRWEPGTLGRPLEILGPGLAMKQYPCCAGTHCALDATFECRAELAPEDIEVIERVEVRVHATGLVPLIYDWPTTGLEAKFCLRYVVSAALIEGAITLDTFDDERISAYTPLMERVSIIVDQEVQERFADVTVHIAGREPVRRRVEEVQGSPSKPLSDAVLDDKFMDCARRAVQEDASLTALSSLRQLDRLDDVANLMKVLSWG